MALDHLRKSDFYMRKLRASVLARDTDNDGLIARSDFNLIVQYYKDAGSPPEHIKEMEKCFEIYYEIWKVPEDKKISIEEFEKNYLEVLEKSYEKADEFFLTMFKQINYNSDGKISIREWQVHNGALGVNAESAKKSFEAMNTRGDGVVTKEEFLAYHKEYFQSTEDKLKSSLLYEPFM